MQRPLKYALLNGWKRRCPNCGEGKIFEGYLSVNDSCPICEQELHHHRADDGPAYLTILITAHILAPFMLIVYEHWRPDPMALSLFFIGISIVLVVYLLPRLKGGFIALQWAKRMHGFK